MAGLRVTERGATLLLMCDGLGHGLGAAERRMPPDRVHGRKESCPNRCWRICTQRCAARAAPSSEWCGRAARPPHPVRGVGNISGFIRWRDGQTRTVSQNGVVGHNVSKVKEYEYAYGGDLLAVFHSDGLSTKWDIDSYPPGRQGTRR